jgi:uncharacterized membrane protein
LQTVTAGQECSERARAAGFSRVARRNNSLSSAGRQLVFIFLFVVSVGIACAFAAAGAWLILPFAGIEMLVLYAAFRYVDRRAADYERIAIVGDKVEVEICEVGRAQNYEFNRCWAQLLASRDGGRLALRSHGREVEIGRHRNDDQRLALAREMGGELRGEAPKAAPYARL